MADLTSVYLTKLRLSPTEKWKYIKISPKLNLLFLHCDIKPTAWWYCYYWSTPPTHTHSWVNGNYALTMKPYLTWRSCWWHSCSLCSNCSRNLLYALTNSVYHNQEISNLHNDFKKQVLIDNCTALLICNFIFYFHIYIYIYIYI